MTQPQQTAKLPRPPGVGECGLGIIEDIPGDLTIEVIGADGGSNLAPGQYRGHEQHTGDPRDCGPPRRPALSATHRVVSATTNQTIRTIEHQLIPLRSRQRSAWDIPLSDGH